MLRACKYEPKNLYNNYKIYNIKYLSTLESLCKLAPRESISDPSNDCMLDKLLSVPQIAGD